LHVNQKFVIVMIIGMSQAKVHGTGLRRVKYGTKPLLALALVISIRKLNKKTSIWFTDIILRFGF